MLFRSPTEYTTEKDWRERLAQTQRRDREIRALGTAHPGFILDTPDFLGARAERWTAFNQATAISSHFNYPLSTRIPLQSHEATT